MPPPLGPKSRTERPRKTKIGKQVAHVTRRTPLSRSKCQRSRSQGATAYCGGLPPTACQFLFPKFIEECNRLLPDGAADSTRCTGLCAHCACPSRTPPQELLKRLKRNNDQLITLQIWMQWRYRVSRATHKAILKLSSEAQNSLN